MSKAANAGTGINLSSKFYIRNFYSENTNASVKANRTNFSKSQLSFEDAKALRRAVKKLNNFAYDEDSSTNIRNSVKAFTETYNNLIASGEETTDKTIQRNIDRLKSLTDEYSDDLDKIGVTVNKDGTLTSRETLLGTADISKFESLFSKDSEYMQKVDNYAKHIRSQSEALYTSEKNRASISAANSDAQTTGKDEPTEAAQIAAQSETLESLLNTGIGKNINLVL